MYILYIGNTKNKYTYKKKEGLIYVRKSTFVSKNSERINEGIENHCNKKRH